MQTGPAVAPFLHRVVWSHVMKKMFVALGVVSFVGLSVVAGCGDDAASDGPGDGSGGGSQDLSAVGEPCSTSADCNGSLLCVSFGQLGYCSVECSAGASECEASASCEGVGALSVDVCPPSNAGTEPGAPPDPQKQPKLLCQSDADCHAIQPGTICAQWNNQKECTIPCSAEADCNTPSAGGVAVDFLTCLVDEADTSRMACVPDEACLSDPFSCIDAPLP
jgi:hypothetical protein